MGIGCALIFFVAVIWALGYWVFSSPENLVFAIVILAVLVFVGYLWRKRVLDDRVQRNVQMAQKLKALATEIRPNDDSYLRLNPKEFVFYELRGVELREYRSTGSSFKGGYLGGNVKLTDGISVSGGGNSGQFTPNEEESTTIDVGTVTYTNQRVLFTGSKQTREWDLSKLIGLDVGVSGQIVTINVSNMSKANALAADASVGITPGILFAMAAELNQNGEAAAKEIANKTAEDIFSQAEDFYRKRGR